MYIVTLKKNEEKRLLQGHPWVFANEVASISGDGTPGSIAKVCGSDGRFIGLGYINHQSKIIVRLLSRKEQDIDEAFFKARINDANQYRLALRYDDNYRVVFGESDLLPDSLLTSMDLILVIQVLTLGIEVRKTMIVELLVDLFHPKGIYERVMWQYVKKKDSNKSNKSFMGHLMVRLKLLKMD
jgi:23S rRNA (cytosine1962-C5)-methyltransferase